jgi:hypothetical protein
MRRLEAFTRREDWDKKEHKASAKTQLPEGKTWIRMKFTLAETQNRRQKKIAKNGGIL